MTLRAKLVCALMLAALLPMLVAVAVSMVSAERRAEQQAARDLDSVERRAAILVERHRARAAANLAQAAAELLGNTTALTSLVGASRPAAGEVARWLAERHGLTYLEILDAGGAVLSSAQPGANLGVKSLLADVAEDRTVLRVLPEAATASNPPLAFLTRRVVPAGQETLQLVGGLAIDREFIASIAEVLGEPVELLNGAGAIVSSSGSLRSEGKLPTESRSGSSSAGDQSNEDRSDTGRPAPVLRSAGGSEENRDAAAARSLADPSSSGGPADASSPPASPPHSRSETVRRSETSLPQARGLLTREIPVGEGGWRLRVHSPSGDVAQARRELLGILAGIAPFALMSALALGFLLAAGISRPIRALARRAEEISAERREPFSAPLPRDEVGRLTVLFDRMLDHLAESALQRVSAERIAAWQDVARRIAHEVKNPLSPIKLAVENLRRTREKAPGDLDRALDVETSTILEEVESLRRLVDEFSQFARLPQPQPGPCDLRQLVTQALSLFAPKVDASGVRVRFDVEPAVPESIHADAEQIGRVLKNVLANALDALEPVSDRRLTISLRSVSGGPAPFAEIEVRDTGIGLAPGSQKKIFEPYVTTRAGRGGTGLGLAIAERIVTEHGGTIQAQGAPGRGTTITIRLPVSGPR